jgi:hypothetical protein
MTDLAFPDARLTVMSACEVQTWPRTFSERLDLNGQTEEFLGGTFEKLHQQQVVERMARSRPIVDETAEPVVTHIQPAPEPFEQGGGIVVEEPYVEPCVAHRAFIRRKAMFEQQALVASAQHFLVGYFNPCV